jgi:3-methyladenine DNA glycosylase AlkD
LLPFIKTLQNKFLLQSDPEKSNWMTAYMLHRFPFYGLQTPVRRAIGKEHYIANPVTDPAELEAIVKECFDLPQREFQYFAIDLYAHHKKSWKQSSIRLMEYCLTQKSWWDSVDGIASEWLGPYFKMFPGQIIPVTGKWNRSKNMWLQRSSIMFQKSFKKDTDTSLLSQYILQNHIKIRAISDYIFLASSKNCARPISVKGCFNKPKIEDKRTGTNISA